MIAENPSPNLPPYTVNAELGVKARIPEIAKQSRNDVRDLNPQVQKTKDNAAAKQSNIPEEKTESKMTQLTEMVQSITKIDDLIRAADKIFNSGNLRATEKAQLIDVVDAKFAQITQDVVAAVTKKVPEITTIEQLIAATGDITQSPRGLSPQEAMFNRQYRNMQSNLEFYRESLQKTVESDT